MSTTWPALSFSEANDYKLDTSCSYMSNDCLVEWRMPTPHTCTSIIKRDKRFVPKLQPLERNSLVWHGVHHRPLPFFIRRVCNHLILFLYHKTQVQHLVCLPLGLHCCMIGVDTHRVPIQVRVETHIVTHVTARSVELVVISFWGRKCPASTT